MIRVLILVALLAVVALPFAIRPQATAPRLADDTVVIITPHNEAIRHEFGQAFARWYQAKTGRGIRVDWRIVGGTSDIARYLESAYDASFGAEWGRRGRRWTSEVRTAFQNPRPAPDASPLAREAREVFLASEVSCGIDVFFGGDAYQFDREARAGRLVDSGMRQRHPDWFRDDVMPARFGGEPFRDATDRWFGVVLSSYGIIFNRDSWRRLGLADAPVAWTDLADERLAGEIGLADPTKSGSVCEAFEAILQQQMQRALEGAPADEARAIRSGWLDGLRIIQGMGANARYFTDSSQKPPIDVANGDCAAGLCIDFYGRQQQEAVRRRARSERVGYVTPVGGSAASTDPVALLRGAPHRDVAVAFIEFTLSPEGQALWALRPGTPGGPERYALRRMPIRRDFYRREDLKPLRSDAEDSPYESPVPFVYHPEWTGNLFREIGFITRVMCQDSHPELVAASRALRAANEPARSRARAVMQNFKRIDYDHTADEIHRVLNSRDRVDEVRLATELGRWFRENYARAKAIAEGTE